MDVLKSIIVNNFQELFEKVKNNNKVKKKLLQEAQTSLIDFVKKDHPIDNDKIIKFINKQLYKSIETDEEKVSVLSLDDFLNNVYLETSRLLWKKPNMFFNLNEISGDIEIIICQNFKKTRPIEEIINDD